MTDENPPDMNQKPCGEYHPLPCGVDKDCGYLELIEELEQLANSWEATMHSSPDAQIQSNECVYELRSLIAEYGETNE